MVAPLTKSGRNQKGTEYQALSTLPIALPINTTGVIIDVSTQTTGTLPVAHGGTGTTSNTGTGAVVLNDSPTFTTQIEMDEGADIVLGTTTGTQIGTAASEKLSLWGTVADVQPTTAITGAVFVAGVGAPVLDDSTFDGYTVGQAIAALRRLGALQ